MKIVRYRFLFLLVFAFFFVLLMVGLFTDTYIRKFLEQQHMKQIVSEVETLERVFNQDLQYGIEINDAYLKQLVNENDADLALLDSNGAVRYTNHATLKVDLYFDVFREIQNKKQNYTILTKENRVYYIHPIKQLDQYLLYGTYYVGFMQIERQLWGMIIFVSLICVVLCTTLINKILQRYLDPIDQVTESLHAVIHGDHSKKIRTHPLNETHLLTLAMDQLLDYLEEITHEHSTNEAWMKTLIENMSAGLILIDEKGCIQIVNRYLEGLIHVSRKACIGKIYHQALEQKDIVQMIEEVFNKEKKIEKQIVLKEGMKQIDLSVHGAPIVSSRTQWRGVVVVFHEITKLKRLEKTRKDFVANVSHELRTPVTSIKGFTETLLEGAYKDEVITHEFLTIIQKESTRMENLVKDLLELSQIEKQDFTLTLSKVNVTEIVHTVIKMLHTALEEKNIVMTFSEEKDFYILADEQRLIQIIVNILTNAKNYTPPNGQIRVEINENIIKNRLEIQISDTGIGIPETDLPRIFERFYRADRARSRDSGGTGLGLSIVKHLMQAHQGRIKVSSKVGEGTTFTLIFPKDIKIK